MSKNIKQDLMRRLVGVDPVDDLLAVKVQDRLCFSMVGFESCLDYVDIRIVEPVLFQGPTLEPLNEIVGFGAAQIENGFYVQCLAEHLGLVDVSRNAIEHQRIVVRMKTPDFRHIINELVPEFDRRLVRNQLAATGVVEEDFANVAVGFEAAKNVPAGA